jgi:hypothetical protein
MLSPRVPVQFAKGVVGCPGLHNSKSGAIAVGFLLLLVAPASLFAQSWGVLLTEQVQAGVFTATGGFCPPSCQTFNQNVIIPPGGGFLPTVAPQSFNISQTIQVPLFGSASINWDATASLGRLHAGIVTAASRPPISGDAAGNLANGIAEIAWQDIFTITSPTLPPGTLVSVRITAALNSSLSESTLCFPSPGQCPDVGDATYILESFIPGNLQNVFTLKNSITDSGANASNQPFDQTFLLAVGQPFVYFADLRAQASATANLAFPASSGSADATAVFHFDVCTQGASYTTASGVSYSSGSNAGSCGSQYEIVVTPTNPETAPSVIACGKLPASQNPIPFQAKFVNTVTGQDAAGGNLVYSLKEEPFSGGHPHLGRQLFGITAPPSGPSPLPYEYFPPEASGDIHLTVTGTAPDGTTPAPASTTIHILTPGITKDLSDTGVLFNVMSHPLGTYGTVDMDTRVSDMNVYYYELMIKLFGEIGPTPLESQSASLPLGGLFDIEQTWHPPHCSHRDGLTIDLSINDKTISERSAMWLAATDAGFSIVQEGSPPHWHLHLNSK